MAERFETRWHGIETGGSVTLDFVNTLDWRLRAVPVELLGTPADLLRWGWSAGLIPLEDAKRLRHWSELHPRRAARSLQRAVELREALATILEAQLRAASYPPAALAVLERGWRAATRARALRPSGGALAWAFAEKPATPDPIVWAVALDAERLLTGPDRKRIGQCADAECGWYFLDVSRNRSRRWCSMEGCGNRNKVRSFYRRTTGRE